jgi:hypothetical protein
MDWAWFLFLAYRCQIGGFGTHYLTTRSADIFLLISLAALVAAFALKGATRGFAILSAFLMVALWVGSEMVA